MYSFYNRTSSEAGKKYFICGIKCDWNINQILIITTTKKNEVILNGKMTIIFIFSYFALSNFIHVLFLVENEPKNLNNIF